MPYVKPDGTVVYGGGRTSALTPQEMDHRDRYNEWVRLPAEKRTQTPQPPVHHDTRAGAMQKYIDPETERAIAARLSAKRPAGGLLDGLRGLSQ